MVAKKTKLNNEIKHEQKENEGKNEIYGWKDIKLLTPKTISIRRWSRPTAQHQFVLKSNVIGHTNLMLMKMIINDLKTLAQ